MANALKLISQILQYAKKDQNLNNAKKILMVLKEMLIHPLNVFLCSIRNKIK